MSFMGAGISHIDTGEQRRSLYPSEVPLNPGAEKARYPCQVSRSYDADRYCLHFTRCRSLDSSVTDLGLLKPPKSLMLLHDFAQKLSVQFACAMEDHGREMYGDRDFTGFGFSSLETFQLEER